jgi:hypothetical protein
VSRVLLIGHCSSDSAALKRVVRQADPSAEVQTIHDEQSLEAALREGADLLLVNRLLDYGFADGTGVSMLRRVLPRYPKTRGMLVSNLPDAQESAVSVGALPGFGKSDLWSGHVVALLRAALSRAED